MARSLVSLLIASVLWIGTLGFATRAPSHADESSYVKPATDAGSVTGTVSQIDYRANTMTVDANGRKIAVTILPSTSIQGAGTGFHSSSEIKRGKRVTVLLSERSGTYSAQLITLR